MTKRDEIVSHMDIEKFTGIDLNSLVGEHVLDAVDMDSAEVRNLGDSYEQCEVLRFRLDGVVYMAVEDPSDGYRSSMKKIFISDDKMKNTFAPCRVVARMSGNHKFERNETLELIDVANGKIILRVGTDNFDDYYPWFVSQWTPENMAQNAA